MHISKKDLETITELFGFVSGLSDADESNVYLQELAQKASDLRDRMAAKEKAVSNYQNIKKLLKEE